MIHRAMSLSGMSPNAGAAAYPETGLAVVSITGADSTSFLDAQCSVRLAGIRDGVGFGAFADAKGRVLLVFRAWRHGDGWRLLVPLAEAGWLHDYLLRFVFRARVDIAVEADWRILGIAGASARSELEHAGVSVPADGHVTTRNGFATLSLDHERWLLCGKPEQTGAPIDTLCARLPAGDENAWRLLRLAAGEPEIRAATRARFLPQMLGLVELGAVSFDKGCYPGQEVITRARNLGTVKRHLGLLEWRATLPPVGTAVRIDGQTVETLDGVSLSAKRCWLQAVVPRSARGELARHLMTTRPPEAE